MTTTERIASGDLELYVYGLLNESETQQIATLAQKEPEVAAEILSIEKSILHLSSSFSPHISSEVYDKIKSQLALKHTQVVDMKPKRSPLSYLGWAAAAVLVIGISYLNNQQKTMETQVVTLENDKSKLEEVVVATEIKNKQTKEVLDIIRDTKNTVITLGGQTVAPTSYAKVYWNKQTQVVYVDAAGLPEPPEGKVYQVWSLKLSPTLTPTSIGLLENFKTDSNKVFAVSKTGDAEAFGITLEPAGGSASPTMEQLYTLGKV
jgi:anti-sigma-K factor RskA